MSNRYNAAGKRLSSMTHARRGHECGLCGRIVYGNGGQVSHGRGHVKRGEAVEMVKDYAIYPPMSSRIFVPTNEGDQIADLVARGFEQVT